MTIDAPHAARRCWHAAINPLHATSYFSPELFEELGALGVTDRVAVNLASRSAAMGAVGPGVVTATFYNYRHDLVTRHLPAVWDTTTPSRSSPPACARWTARCAASSARRRSPRPSSPKPPTSRYAPPRPAPGTAAPSTPPTPTSPSPRNRTCGSGTPPPSCASTAGTGTSPRSSSPASTPLEALVSHTATGRGMTEKWVKSIRGWEQSDLDAAADRLRARGVLDGDGELTEEGRALRERLETETDRLDAAPYEHLGASGVARLHALGGALVQQAIGAGAFPPDLFGKG